MLIFCVLVAEQDGIELAHVEKHRLVERFPMLVTLELSLELIILEHIYGTLRNLTLYLHTLRLLVFLLLVALLVYKGQVLTTHLDQVTHFKIRVFNAGTTICNVDENALGSFIVLALDRPAHIEHKICRLLFNLHEWKVT